MNTLGFLLRMLRRDARAGELHLLVAARVVAVATQRRDRMKDLKRNDVPFVVR